MSEENALRVEKSHQEMKEHVIEMKEMMETMKNMMENMMKGKNSVENTNAPNVAIP